jgi:cytochrome c-type biogenesis protein CcsB
MEGRLPARSVWLVTLAQVAMLGMAAAALLVWAQQPYLSATTNPTHLLSTAVVTPMALMVWLATLLALVSTRYPRLTPYAWLLLLGATGLAVGISITIPWETSRILASGNWGISNLYEVSVLTLALTGTLALGFDQTMAPGRFLPFTTPILSAAAAFTYWLTRIGASTPTELVPALQNSILPFHVIANFIGYGCFAIGAAAGAAMLWRAAAEKSGRPTRLPPMATLEKIGYRAVVIGFPVFSLAILLGCLWAYQAWGGYWSWDPKETWALIVWLIYAAYLHARVSHRKTRPLVLAWWLLVGFAATLICYIGVNMFLSGLHSYGSLAA